jgi:CopG family nickel-responsive transcriptional regulator
MTRLARAGIALPEGLLKEFDELIARRNYANRSEAVRDLIRNELVSETAAAPGAEVFGTVTLVYDHHSRLLPERLTELQHKHFASIISTTHVHLDHDNCLEVILVRGKSAQVSSLANKLIAMKGVKHGRFTVTTSGRNLP